MGRKQPSKEHVPAKVFLSDLEGGADVTGGV